jgi:hypothetical protein
MPALLAAAVSWFLALVPLIVVKFIIALGVSAVAYVGTLALINQIVAQVMGAAGSIGGDLAAFLGLAKLDVAMSMITSAIISKYSILAAGMAITKIQWGGAAPPAQ